MRPSPYHIPGYILHLPAQTRVIEDADEARRLISNQPAYILQRYVTSGDHIVRKLRTVWSGPRRVLSRIVQKLTVMPYNSPNMPVPKEKKRKGSLLISAATEKDGRRRSQLLLHHTETMQQPQSDLPQDWEHNYLVSFTQPKEVRVVDVGLQDRAPEACAVVDFFSGLLIAGRWKMTALVMDLVQDWDNKWVFLNLKRVTMEEVVEDEERKTAGERVVDLSTVHRENEALYLQPRTG